MFDVDFENKISQQKRVKFHSRQSAEDALAHKMSLDARKPVFGSFRTTKVQTSLPLRLISAIGIRFWEIIISKFATGETSIF